MDREPCTSLNSAPPLSVLLGLGEREGEGEGEGEGRGEGEREREGEGEGRGREYIHQVHVYTCTSVGRWPQYVHVQCTVHVD